MPARKSVNQDARIVTALLTVAAAKGWAGISIESVARAAKIKPADVARTAPDKHALLALLARHIDDQVAKQVAEIDPTQSEKDRLFEALMARFDVLQDMRAGMKAIMTGLCQSPADGVPFLPTLAGSMEKTFHAAGLPMDFIKKYFLTGIYLKILTVWIKDESADLAETMAAADRDLDLYQRLTRCSV